MFSNLSFLYVEDDPASRQVIEILLGRVYPAKRWLIMENSSEFPSILDHLDFMPDVFLLDVHVKPYSGFDMLWMIRQRPAFDAVKVIALTASVMADEVDELRRAGFNSLIGKPINPKIFPEYILSILKDDEIWSISWDD